MQQKATDAQTELIVPLKESERCCHFSVYDGEVHYYGKFQRVAVTVDMKKGTHDCRCCNRNRSCIHKNVCKWYLRQQSLLDKFLGAEDNSGNLRVDMRDETTEPNPKIASERQAKIIYPPSDEDALKAMCIYLNSK